MNIHVSYQFMFTISSWNVNSIAMRLPRLLSYLERSRPDVLCLQELKCTEDKFPFEAVSQAGYDALVVGQKTYNGVAILAKHPIKTIAKNLPNFSEDPQARLVAAEVRGITVVCGYFPNGQEVGSEKYQYKLTWMRHLADYLAGQFDPSAPLVLTGDFNVAPTDDDVHDPNAWREKILCSQAERLALNRLQGWGLHDTFRKHVAGRGFYSWWDYRNLGFPKNLGLRIDLVLATQPLYEKCVGAQILREERKGEKPSDHAPVSAVFSD